MAEQRGILRSRIERHLQDVEARGEPLSVLNASESVICGRYGYGAATRSSGFEGVTTFGVGAADGPVQPELRRLWNLGLDAEKPRGR